MWGMRGGKGGRGRGGGVLSSRTRIISRSISSALFLAGNLKNLKLAIVTLVFHPSSPSFV